MKLQLNQLTRGDRFQGADGGYWTVLRADGVSLTAIREGRAAFTAATSDAEVEVSNRTGMDDELLEAVANVADAMPGSLLLSEKYASIHEIRSHIEIMHGQHAGDMRTSKQLSAAHAEMHDDNLMKVDHRHGGNENE